MTLTSSTCMTSHIGTRGAMAVFSTPNIGYVIHSHPAHTSCAPAHHHKARDCMHTAAALDPETTPVSPKQTLGRAVCDAPPNPGTLLHAKSLQLRTCSRAFLVKHLDGLTLSRHLHGPSDAALLRMKGAWKGGNAPQIGCRRTNHPK